MRPQEGRRDVEKSQAVLVDALRGERRVVIPWRYTASRESSIDRDLEPPLVLLHRWGSKSMTVYVAEIKGRGIAAFQADTGSDAERLVHDRILRDDLMIVATGGLPLWDGVTDIEVRLARPDEEAKWRASRAKAIRRGNIEENDVGWIAFLVALTDRRNGDRAGRKARRSMAARRRAPI
jgi:hypothetical protein